MSPHRGALAADEAQAMKAHTNPLIVGPKSILLPSELDWQTLVRL